MSSKPKTKPTSGVAKRKPRATTKPTGGVATKPKGKLEARFPPAKDPEASEAMARFAISPKVQAALTVQTFAKTFGTLELASVARSLGESIKQVQGGDMKECEAMLMGQAHSLQAIFRNLSAQAEANIGHFPKAVDSYLRLALKAQSQCRATLEALSAIKNPPVLFAKQANFANGPQQVNNGPAPHTGKVETVQNELMEAQDAERVDTGTQGEASRGHSTLEAVEAEHRAQD
jgi:hypothetical protein